MIYYIVVHHELQVMTAPIAMSNVNQCCTPEDDDEIHIYKKCMKDIAHNNPNLPLVAIQQMTLKRCAVIQEERKQRKKSNLSDSLRSMMRKLRLSNNNKREEHDTEMGSTIGSSTEQQQQLDTEGWRNGRSIACRRSVASISSEDRSAALAQLVDFNDDESLSNSLQNIESSIMFDPSTPDCNKRRSRRSLVDSKRSSKRVSDMSLGLSDVEEYELPSELESNVGASKVICSQIGDTSLVNRSQSDSSFEKKEESSTRLLPDEIKVLLNDFNADNNSNKKGKKKKEILCQLESKKRRSNNSSVSHRSSSILSTDSENFEGDFAAWASLRRLSSN